MKNKIYYNWNQFDEDIKRLVRIYKSYNGMIKNIYGVPKGGLIVAVKLCNLLNIPLIIDKKEISRRTLVIDDIADTGKTLKNLLKDKKYFGLATLWINDKTKFIPTTYCRIKRSDEWIVFCWEK